MAMLSWSNKLRADDSGNTVLEFAFLTPILFLILVGTLDIGRSLLEANSIEKGLRAGAMFLARSEDPTDGATMLTAANLVRTGTLDGSGEFLVEGWGSPSAVLAVSTSDFATGDRVIPVIRMEATVPYQTMAPGLTEMLGLSSFTIRLSHEQAYIGD